MNQSRTNRRDLDDPEERRRLIAALQGDSRANADARRLLITATVVGSIVLIVYATDRATWLRVPVAYCLPAFLTYALLLAALLYLRGRATIPKLIFAAGVLLTVGGVFLDMVMTAIKTPTLELEANPIVRALLGARHSLTFIYWYAIVGQGLFTAFICLFWAAFLRNRLTLILSAWRAAASGKAAFVKAALGGGQLTWRQFLFPMRISELPTAYHMAWLFSAVLMAMGPYRLYLGLCWLGWGSFTYHVAACAVAMLLTTSCYLAWLLIEASKVHPQAEGVTR